MEEVKKALDALTSYINMLLPEEVVKFAEILPRLDPIVRAETTVKH